jgi:hypothetical protein
MIANEKEIAPMSTVQERIQENEPPAPKPSNVNVADRVAESIIHDLCRILLKRLVDLRKMTADGFLVQDRINEAIEELLRWRAQAVDKRLAPCGDDQLRALHDALGRTFTERKFRFLNFVSDGNKNGIPAEKPN